MEKPRNPLFEEKKARRIKQSEREKQDNIPLLNPHFYKSRNSLLLFSAFLLAWELIGVKIEEASSSGLKLKIQNVDAIPYVLFILIAYFLYRVTIEWYQSSPTRRLLKQSKIDFIVTLSIPFLALFVYSVQRWVGFSVFQKYGLIVGIIIFSIGFLYVAFVGIYFLIDVKLSKAYRPLESLENRMYEIEHPDKYPEIKDKLTPEDIIVRIKKAKQSIAKSWFINKKTKKKLYAQIDSYKSVENND